MPASHKITLLGAGLIGTFYTMTLHDRRGRDRVHTVCAKTEAEAEVFARKWDIPRWTSDIAKAVDDSETDLVVVGLPNDLHKEAVLLAARAGKPVLCTKPLGRNAAEAWEMLEAVEKAGVFAGYLEDLVYTPKTLKSLDSIRAGALGRILWVRSRETHPGPHSAWFWDKKIAGGGAIVDMGCHCIEIIRNFIGKGVRPVEVLATADTLVHPIAAEDSGIGLIRFENRAIGQFEVSWTFRGGMDLRDEVAGTEGTIWLDHFLRTGFEMFTAKGLGGYVVNAIIDACYRSAESKRWEPVELDRWTAEAVPKTDTGAVGPEKETRNVSIKLEMMVDGTTKIIKKDLATGEIIEKIVDK